MDQIHGKQIKDATIADGKLVELYIKADGTRSFTNPVSGIDPTLSAHLTTKNYVDALFQGRQVKQSCRIATTANITLSGNQTIDGVLTVTGNRILVKNQTLGQNNGIYIADAGAWTRSTDADVSADVTAGMIVPVEEGSQNADSAWELTTDNPIVLATTPLVFSFYAGIKSNTITTSNKEMTASVTASDGQQACATTLTAAPARGGYVAIMINGIQVTIGDGVKTKACYFSADGGTTAKAFSALAAGDILYWNGSIALYQLAASDRVDFIYDVAQ